MSFLNCDFRLVVLCWVAPCLLVVVLGLNASIKTSDVATMDVLRHLNTSDVVRSI